MEPTGYIYFLINASIPNLVKIGYTMTSVEQRMLELNTTGVPEPFIAAATFHVANPATCEQELHGYFSKNRKFDRREFFAISLNTALIEVIPIITRYITSEVATLVPEANAISSLTLPQREILTQLVHCHLNRPRSAEDIASEISIHVQKVILDVGILVEHELLKESYDRRYNVQAYHLTHKGRKYCFDHDLVIPDLLDQP